VVGETAVRLAAAGLPGLILRDHDAEEDAFRERVMDLADALRMRNPDVWIAVNAHPAAAAAGRAAFHASSHGPRLEVAIAGLPDGTITGASVHGTEAAIEAVNDGCDYLLVAPIYDTGGKKGQGVELIKEIAEVAPAIPIIALGGITPEKVGDCLAAGAHGVAVLSGLLASPDPVKSLQDYLAALT